LQYLSINRKKIGRLSRIRPNGRIKTLWNKKFAIDNSNMSNYYKSNRFTFQW
jgi:hypothetical protein